MSVVLSTILQTPKFHNAINKLRKKHFSYKLIWLVISCLFVGIKYVFNVEFLNLLSIIVLYFALPPFLIKFSKFPQFVEIKNELLEQVNHGQNHVRTSNFIVFYFKKQNKFAMYFNGYNHNATFFKQDDLVLSDADVTALLGNVMTKYGDSEDTFIINSETVETHRVLDFSTISDIQKTITTIQNAPQKVSIVTDNVEFTHELLKKINLQEVSEMDKDMLKGILTEYDKLADGDEKAILKAEIIAILTNIENSLKTNEPSSALMSKINYFKVKYASKIIH